MENSFLMNYLYLQIQLSCLPCRGRVHTSRTEGKMRETSLANLPSYLFGFDRVVKTVISDGIAVSSLPVEPLFGQLNPPTLLRRPFLGHSETHPVQRLPGSNEKTSWMEFFWFIGEAQVVVSSSGWWNLSLLLLALSLGHLAEPVAELPAQKAV